MIFARLETGAARLTPASREPFVRGVTLSEVRFGRGFGSIRIATDGAGTSIERSHVAAAWTRAVGDYAEHGSPEALAFKPRALVSGTSEGLRIERGPYGGDSVYYAREPAGFVVSTRLQRLVGALGEPPELDIDRLAALGVTRLGLDPRATVYRGVRRLLSCESVLLGWDGSVRSHFCLPKVPDRREASDEENARAMRELLLQIVAEQVRPYSAVAVLTGGGVDSSALLAMVLHATRSAGGARCTGLTMDFEAPGDDRPHLRALLEHVGGTTIRVSPQDSGAIPLDFFVQDAAPATWPTQPVGRLVAEQARGWGAEAVFTGDPGDLVIDGDLSTFPDRLACGDLTSIADIARLQVPWDSTPMRKVLHLLVKPALRRAIPPGLLRRRRERWLREQEVWKWAGPRVKPLLAEPTFTVRGDDEWLTALALSHDLSESADGFGQTESVWGIPFLNPYLDHRFVEFVGSLPPEQLFMGDRTRGMFRVAMTGLLPDSVRLRGDKSSFEPLIDSMFASAGGMAAFRSLLTMEATADLGFVVPAEFRRTFDRVVRRLPTARGWVEVWPMLSIEAFLRCQVGSRSTFGADWRGVA